MNSDWSLRYEVWNISRKQGLMESIFFSLCQNIYCCNRLLWIRIIFAGDNECIQTYEDQESKSCVWLVLFSDVQNPAGNYIFKVNNRNTRRRCEICSKLIIKTPEPSQLRRSGVFIVNFEHISDLVIVFLLLTLSR